MSRPTLVAVVVSKGLDALLRQCLESWERAARAAGDRVEPHAVVVDNASASPYDRSALEGRGTGVLRLDVPHSFAAANHAGLRAHDAAFGTADLVLLLNNDVLLAEGALIAMLDALDAVPNAGICGARLVFPDDSIQHCGVVFGAGETGPYHVHRREPSRAVGRGVREWQAVTGACLLVRRAVWDELGGLDTSYPFGLEDVDLCLRARQRGVRVVCANDFDSLHFESMTEGRVALDVPSRLLFMQRWSGRYTIDG